MCEYTGESSRTECSNVRPRRLERLVSSLHLCVRRRRLRREHLLPEIRTGRQLAQGAWTGFQVSQFRHLREPATCPSRTWMIANRSLSSGVPFAVGLISSDTAARSCAE